MNKIVFNRVFENKLHIIWVISFSILFSCFFAGCSSVLKSSKSTSEQNETVTANKPIEIAADVEKMMNTIQILSANSREIGSPGGEKAFEYQKKQFESYGYETQVQKFPYIPKQKKSDHRDIKDIKKEESENLIAVKKSKGQFNKGIIIISAHYDSAENSPGANDDASGVSVVIETARLLNQLPSNYEIHFILFGGEEHFLSGADYYKSNLSEEYKNNIKANIELDSIAQEGAGNVSIFTVNGKENAATAILKDSIESGSLELKKTKSEVSDYVLLNLAGIPALVIGQSNGSNLKINSPEDTFSRIDKTRLKSVADMVIKAMVKVISS